MIVDKSRREAGRCRLFQEFWRSRKAIDHGPKGRDISVDEGRLSFDGLTRHLTYSPKSRQAAGADKVMLAVVNEVARASDPVSIREVHALFRGRFAKAAVEAALKMASVAPLRYLSRVKGPKGSQLHSITSAGREFLAGAMASDGTEAP